MGQLYFELSKQFGKKQNSHPPLVCIYNMYVQIIIQMLNFMYLTLCQTCNSQIPSPRYIKQNKFHINPN